MGSDYERTVPPGAAVMGDQTRDEWIAEAVARVRSGQPFSFAASGDSFIAAFRMDGEGEVFWVDCKLRREGGGPLGGASLGKGEGRG